MVEKKAGLTKAQRGAILRKLLFEGEDKEEENEGEGEKPRQQRKRIRVPDDDVSLELRPLVRKWYQKVFVSCGMGSLRLDDDRYGNLEKLFKAKVEKELEREKGKEVSVFGGANVHELIQTSVLKLKSLLRNARRGTYKHCILAYSRVL